MENQKNNSNLKAIITVLAVLLVGSLVYIFKITSDAKALQTELTKTTSEKDSVTKDLEALKATYDAAIAENTSMSDELIAEREKVVNLLADLKRSKGDVASMAKYKKQYLELEEKMKVLMQENEVLKKANETLTVQRDSTVMVLGEAKKFNEVLVGQNQELSKTVEVASKLIITNLKTAAYKLKSKGRQIATEKAKSADVLKINFTIAENKNNVLGDKQSENFNGNILTYSFISTVKFENKTVDVSQDLQGSNFQKGSYTVNLFDNGELVSKTNFTLK